MFERACIFIDGENLRYTLLSLLEADFRREDYLPKNANWGGFIEHLANEGEASRLTRAYWYVVRYLDFWPWGLPRDDAEKLERVLMKDRDTKALLDACPSGQARESEARRIAERLRGRERMMASRFQGWTTIQDGIMGNDDCIEFRRSGALTYNLFQNRFGKEKGVDVKLATDLLELRNIYDVAIIVSGDQDYVPAVQVVKDSGKRVVNTCFLDRDGHLLPGGARRLNIATDRVLQVEYDQVRELLLGNG